MKINNLTFKILRRKVFSLKYFFVFVAISDPKIKININLVI